MSNGIIPENYNSKNLVQLWRGFIDWEKRRKGEGGFLLDQLRQHKAQKIFDASLGDGCDSIYLLKLGFDVTSNEVDQVFLQQAVENAKREHVALRITSYDWRNLDKEFPEESFDAIILLGNSLTYLFIEDDRRHALEQFKRILKSNGILIIDERNYQYILDRKKEILEGNFQYSGQYVYCGETVHGTPIEIDEQHVKFEYVDEASETKGYLTLYPFKRGELKRVLQNTGFTNVTQYSDYKSAFDLDADFYQYVCQK